MTKIKDLTINESEYDLENGNKGKIAVFMYGGNSDPSKILNYAINEYVGDNPYYELMDYSMSNPWMRVVVSNINDMKQESFDNYIKRRERKEKLKYINEK
jgi:hypothetical protein